MTRADRKYRNLNPLQVIGHSFCCSVFCLTEIVKILMERYIDFNRGNVNILAKLRLSFLINKWLAKY